MRILLLLLLMTAQANAINKPFWTEKSSFNEGNRVYFVGIASNAKSISEGRKLAIISAENELKSYLQVSQISGITLNTQMTYDENDGDHFNVYRLMYVTQEDITKFKEELLTQERAVLSKQSEVLKNESLKREDLMQEILNNTTVIEDKNTAINALNERIQKLTNDAQTKVKCGFTTKETKLVLGKERASTECVSMTYLNYGQVWLVFEKGILTCYKSLSNYSYCSKCHPIDPCPGNN